ncbi:MAG TPA: YeeE/YedE family protein [Streptosporangiaceae bacterium]|jgi:hypothetical protein
MSVLDGIRTPALLKAPSRPAPAAAPAPPVKIVPLIVGVVAAVALGVAVQRVGGTRTLWLYVIGLALGVALFHSRFGFTSAWRQLVTVGQGRALRAHMLMLGTACVLFAPILSGLVGFGGPKPAGNIEPISAGLFIGAFAFGVGMQLGGSCASGTLFAIGSGQSAIVLTLAGFITGSVLGTATFSFWTDVMPVGPEVSLAQSRLGYGGALVVQLAIMAAIALATLAVARRRRPPEIANPPRARGLRRVVRGAWPLWAGALALAALNAATLAVSGKPWGITSAFALWGAKIAQGLGLDVAGWSYWSAPKNAAMLNAPVLADKTSVMDVGIMLGALAASAAAGTFVLHRRVPWRLAAGAIAGGILMGYGARIAYGCNIGSYFSGIASFSLHGWIWGAMALLGTFGGVALRPLIGQANPKPTDSVC